MVEFLPSKQAVAGSNPVSRSTLKSAMQRHCRTLCAMAVSSQPAKKPTPLCRWLDSRAFSASRLRKSKLTPWHGWWLAVGRDRRARVHQVRLQAAYLQGRSGHRPARRWTSRRRHRVDEGRPHGARLRPSRGSAFGPASTPAPRLARIPWPDRDQRPAHRLRLPKLHMQAPNHRPRRNAQPATN